MPKQFGGVQYGDLERCSHKLRANFNALQKWTPPPAKLVDAIHVPHVILFKRAIETGVGVQSQYGVDNRLRQGQDVAAAA